jgi:3-hydroxybutyryl-CoA dehydrogenase
MPAHLGVVGFGAMGSEIALLGACAGLKVTAFDKFPEALEKGTIRLARVLKLLSRDQKFFAADRIADDAGREAVLSGLATTSELSGLAGCDFIIEAAPEIPELKQSILTELCSLVSAEAIIASNTSSISITELASATSCPERVVGMHFFNPPTAMGLVEVIPGEATAEDAVGAATELAKQLGKRPVRVRETPGFVVNRVLLAMMTEAIRLAEDEVASIPDIDEAMKLGAGFPMGPFKLADLVGLDVIEHACDSIYRGLDDPKFRPPELLRQRVRDGHLGRKTREGFYKY